MLFTWAIFSFSPPPPIAPLYGNTRFLSLLRQLENSAKCVTTSDRRGDAGHSCTLRVPQLSFFLSLLSLCSISSLLILFCSLRLATLNRFYPNGKDLRRQGNIHTFAGKSNFSSEIRMPSLTICDYLQ